MSNYQNPEQPYQGSTPQYDASQQQYAAQTPQYDAGGYQQATSQYGAGQASYGASYGAPQSDKKTLSMVGLICGIAGIILPFWLPSIAGGVLSGIGMAKEPNGKTMAIWGLILSVLGFIWSFVFWFAVLPLIMLMFLGAALSTYPTYTY